VPWWCILIGICEIFFISYFKVTSRYYWSTVGEDCNETVKRCDVCQRSQKKFAKPASKLHPIEVKDIVWHRIGIDLVGPLPETSRGNKYLITCTDYFSKWPEAAPLKTKSADGMYICFPFCNWLSNKKYPRTILTSKSEFIKS
jgi:hypothetical protein